MLFSKEYNDPFNLLKYADSVHEKIKSKNNNKNYKAMLLTNTTFHFFLNNKNYMKLEKFQAGKKWVKDISNIKLEICEKDDLFSMCNARDTTCYKFIETTTDTNIDENVVTILEEQAKYVKPKGKKKILPLSKIEIKEALKNIFYVVNVPDEKDVEGIIKDKLKSHFQLASADAIYDRLQSLFINWCNTKDKIHEKQKDANIIEFGDIDAILKNLPGENCDKCRNMKEIIKEIFKL